MFCLLVVLVELSVLAKWLARKTPLTKPNHCEGIISRKPRPKSAHDFLGLLYCFIVLLCRPICVVSCPYVIYYPTVMARYCLFVLKVSLNPKQTNKQTLLCSPKSKKKHATVWGWKRIEGQQRIVPVVYGHYCIAGSGGSAVSPLLQWFNTVDQVAGFPFSASTLLVGRQKQKMCWVFRLWRFDWKLWTSYSSTCHH